MADENTSAQPEFGARDTVSAGLFAQFFRPHIRTFFDWERFLEGDWPVKVLALQDREALGRWYCPWNVDGDGREADFTAPGARPLRFAEIPSHLSGLDERRQQVVQAFRQQITDAATIPPVQIVAPAYELLDGVGILLDGTHRLAALMVTAVPFRLLCFAIQGPIDNAIMPELRHWEKEPILRKWK